MGRPGPSIRKQRWRERQRRGVVVADVEVSAATLDFLIGTHWLREPDATDPAAIGSAISQCSKTPPGADSCPRVDSMNCKHVACSCCVHTFTELWFAE